MGSSGHRRRAGGSGAGDWSGNGVGRCSGDSSQVERLGIEGNAGEARDEQAAGRDEVDEAMAGDQVTCGGKR